MGNVSHMARPTEILLTSLVLEAPLQLQGESMNLVYLTLGVFADTRPVTFGPKRLHHSVRCRMEALELIIQQMRLCGN